MGQNAGQAAAARGARPSVDSGGRKPAARVPAPAGKQMHRLRFGGASTGKGIEPGQPNHADAHAPASEPLHTTTLSGDMRPAIRHALVFYDLFRRSQPGIAGSVDACQWPMRRRRRIIGRSAADWIIPSDRGGARGEQIPQDAAGARGFGHAAAKVPREPGSAGGARQCGGDGRPALVDRRPSPRAFQVITVGLSRPVRVGIWARSPAIAISSPRTCWVSPSCLAGSGSKRST